MMEQYFKAKEQFPDAIMLFRMGDFYETFYEDAKLVSRLLDITLTKRSHGTSGDAPLAGIPYHALDTYLGKLVKQGYKVAICEQVEDPKQAKGLVKREVVRVVTPGTLVEDALLSADSNNYLVAVSPGKTVGIALVDLSTGEFRATEISGDDARMRARDELVRLAPSEILLPEGADYDASNAPVTRRPAEDFHPSKAASTVKKHFNIGSLRGLGLSGRGKATEAAGAVLAYLAETQMRTLAHITTLGYYDTGNYMVLDETTLRNLELTRNIASGDTRGTLLAHMDRCLTPMGRRMLRRWLLQPLMNPVTIARRQEAAAFIAGDEFLLHDIKDALAGVRDMERLSSRCSYGSATPRDLGSLRDTLNRLPLLHSVFDGRTLPEMLRETLSRIDTFEGLAGELAAALVENPPVHARDGGIIRDGYDENIDKLRDLCTGGREWISSMQEREREETGIKSLKIGYNKVFGYYIEVSKANSDRVPEHYIRKQTLVNSERYITPELKEMEEKVVTAQERMDALEGELFARLLEKVTAHLPALLETSSMLATVDVLCTLADLSRIHGYTFPNVGESGEIRISKGRHPTVETLTDAFVPNDVTLDTEGNRTLIVTGPNMSGKSTYMRQVALITIMAQMGAPIPAESAEIGIVDRIFTRVGAFDDLVHGQSTFMVEMVEMANILNCATPRSLIILDEIGRGTSTYDGLAIAWAVVEHCNSKVKLGAKTLFATHYHELTELAEILDGVVNVHIAIKEEKGDIIFLREIRPGPANRSYGVEVAKLAGLPPTVIERAKEVLKTVEEEALIEVRKGSGKPKYTQLVLFQQDASHPIVEELKDISIDEMTPLEALNLLKRLRDRAREER